MRSSSHLTAASLAGISGLSHLSQEAVFYMYYIYPCSRFVSLLISYQEIDLFSDTPVFVLSVVARLEPTTGDGNQCPEEGPSLG